MVKMPSFEFYMANKVDNLRHELASRGLPTEGLKRDLAFRLANSDNTHASRPISLPRRTNGVPSKTTDKEAMVVQMKDHNISNTEIRNRGPKRSPSSQTNPSVPSVQHHYYRSTTWRNRGLDWISTILKTISLSIIMGVFLSCIIWRCLPTVDQEYLMKRIDDGHDFASSKIHSWQNSVIGQFNKRYHSMCSGVQPFDGFFEAGTTQWC